MNPKALLVGLGFGLAVLLGMVVLRTLQGLVQSLVQIAVVLVVVYVAYELWAGWTAGV